MKRQAGGEHFSIFYDCQQNSIIFYSASFLLIKTIEDENPHQNVYITSNLHSDSIGRIHIIEKTAYFNYKFK
jgi:hypothetical protein